MSGANEPRNKPKTLSRINQGLGHVFSDDRWRDLFGDEKFVLIDVGALGGLGKEWRGAASLMRAIGFDPLEGALTIGPMTVLNMGLDSAPGTRELHLAGHGPMSSFLPPDREVWAQFGWDAPLERRLVKTTTLDEVVRDQHLRFVDFIKLDTQGSELDILKGGPIAVGKMALGLRIEVSFYRHYEAQPLFADLDPHVRSQGFDLIDLLHLSRKRHAYIGAADKALLETTDGQLLQADALYFRAPTRFAAHLQTMGSPEQPLIKVAAA